MAQDSQLTLTPRNAMTYEQKLAALNALSECSILMRSPGDWYVSQRVETRGDGVLIGQYGNGPSPEKAIEDHWDVLTSVKYPQYLIANSSRPDRKAVIWNGFMWDHVIDEKAA